MVVATLIVHSHNYPPSIYRVSCERLCARAACIFIYLCIYLLMNGHAPDGGHLRVLYVLFRWRRMIVPRAYHHQVTKNKVGEHDGRDRNAMKDQERVLSVRMSLNSLICKPTAS